MLLGFNDVLYYVMRQVVDWRAEPGYLRILERHRCFHLEGLYKVPLAWLLGTI